MMRVRTLDPKPTTCLNGYDQIISHPMYPYHLAPPPYTYESRLPGHLESMCRCARSQANVSDFIASEAP